MIHSKETLTNPLSTEEPSQNLNSINIPLRVENAATAGQTSSTADYTTTSQQDELPNNYELKRRTRTRNFQTRISSAWNVNDSKKRSLLSQSNDRAH